MKQVIELLALQKGVLLFLVATTNKIASLHIINFINVKDYKKSVFKIATF
ncbi:MAG TPA: hypothetical protein GXX15_00295 [Clostridia bacterium]|nr:hypothetical protein [Clostridia bacterium]